MNDDIHEILGKALPESEPPVTFSPESLMATGKRRRRFRAAGAISGGVAVVAALAISVPIAVGQVAVSDQAAQGGELPELEADEMYGWEGYEDRVEPTLSQPTAESEKYGDAFWSWFEKNKPGFEYTSDDFLKDQGEISSELPSINRYEEALFIDTDHGVANSATARAGYERAVYALTPPSAATGENSWALAGLPMVQMPGAESSDTLDAVVYPAGTYTDGTEGPFPYMKAKGDENFFDLVRCEGGLAVGNFLYDLRSSATFDIECNETQTADGARVVEATESVTDDQGKLVSKTNALVLYRFDGTAIVLRDSVPGPDAKDVNVADLEPALSFDELADLATSLPDDAVE